MVALAQGHVLHVILPCESDPPGPGTWWLLFCSRVLAATTGRVPSALEAQGTLPAALACCPPRSVRELGPAPPPREGEVWEGLVVFPNT